MDDDDDYWNTSETKAKAFSFDDDVLSLQEIRAIGQKTYPGQSEDNIFGSTINAAKTNLLPIASLVSPKVLDLIILAQSGKDPTEHSAETAQTVSSTVRRLTLGRATRPHVHRSLRSKKQLLAAACALGDGDAVLTVVLFLIQSLNKKLVYELLSSQPLALARYLSFLQDEGRVTELADLLAMLGRSSEAAMYQYQHYVKSQGDNVDGLLRKMTHLMANHFNQPGVDPHQCKMVADYVKLLEWQRYTNKPELYNKPALTCLAHCCSHHWTEGAGNMMSPLTVCQRQQISPLQYDWVVLNVHGKAKKWDIVESIFTKKNWLGRNTVWSRVPAEALLARLHALGGGSRLLADCLHSLPAAEDRRRLAAKYKSVVQHVWSRVPAQALLARLHALGGGSRLLADCLHSLPAAEDRRRLAAKYKVHSVVIEDLAKQKDRAALTNYKLTLSPQSEAYILAENCLRDSSIKWKN